MKFEELVGEFSEKNEPKFFDFVEKNFHNNYILLNKDFLKWQYGKNYDKNLSINILEYKDEILGYQGLIPLKFNFFGVKIVAKCLSNIIVDEKIKKLGLGSILIKSAEKDVDLLYVVGYNSKVEKIFNQMGWVTNMGLRRFIYIINAEKSNQIAKTKKFKVKNDKFVYNNNYIFERVNNFDNSINEFWQRVVDKYPITIQRDRSYLNWRYSNHPLIDYYLFISKNNDKKIESFIILRIEKPQDYKIGRIIDFVSTDASEEFTLAKLIEFCKNQNVDFIDFFFTGNFHIKSLDNLGFMEANKEPYSQIPQLFNPIDRTKKTINFAFKIVNESLKFEKNNINNWYLTKGDSDQDRPNPQ